MYVVKSLVLPLFRKTLKLEFIPGFPIEIQFTQICWPLYDLKCFIPTIIYFYWCCFLCWSCCCTHFCVLGCLCVCACMWERMNVCACLTIVCVRRGLEKYKRCISCTHFVILLSLFLLVFLQFFMWSVQWILWIQYSLILMIRF